MDVSPAVTDAYAQCAPSTPLSKLRGIFEENDDVRVVLVVGDDGVAGVVPRDDLVSSHQDPDEKAASVMRSPPRVDRTEDVREVARLMVESGLKLLPAFEGEQFVGVVTDRSILRVVRENLDALDVEDVFTRDLVYVSPETTLGEVIGTLRNHGVSHVPVVDGDRRPVGMVSIYDLVEFATREMKREQGGSHDGFDGHGGQGSTQNYRTHGGRGERAGVAARMLDLPVRDVMTTPAETVDADVPLGAAVERMLEMNYSSLLVASDDVAFPLGIVTTTDVLRALTVTEERHLPVQVFNVDLLTDLSRETIAERIEEIDGKYGEMDVLEANVVFHRHDETRHGVPLLLATTRLFTDEGRFSGSGEGYGARAAFDESADTLERNVLEDKDRKSVDKTAADSPEKRRERNEKLLGWWLES